MPTLIIGSTAMRRLLGDLGTSTRVPKDLDVFSDELNSGADDVFWDPAFDRWLEGSNEPRLATLDELYTIKVSHSYWELPNGSWAKHMYDQTVLKAAGAKLLPSLHKLLYEVWERKHGKKQVNLDMTSEDFFTSAVPRKYDHDSIHASVAYYDQPLYTEIMVPGAEVKIDSKAMWALEFDDLIKLFREEVYATALERIMIPRNYKGSAGAAYQWALRRTITSLTKGRSAQFMSENFDILARADVDYVQRHLQNADKLILLEF